MGWYIYNEGREDEKEAGDKSASRLPQPPRLWWASDYVSAGGVHRNRGADDQLHPKQHGEVHDLHCVGQRGSYTVWVAYFSRWQPHNRTCNYLALLNCNYPRRVRRWHTTNFIAGRHVRCNCSPAVAWQFFRLQVPHINHLPCRVYINPIPFTVHVVNSPCWHGVQTDPRPSFFQWIQSVIDVVKLRKNAIVLKYVFCQSVQSVNC